MNFITFFLINRHCFKRLEIESKKSDSVFDFFNTIY
jgi:hypothetical protein